MFWEFDLKILFDKSKIKNIFNANFYLIYQCFNLKIDKIAM